MNTEIQLIKKIQEYFPNLSTDFIIKAYSFSMEAHKNQKRASGDIFFSHPLGVANILADIKLDPLTIIAGLLHDTVEDTPVTIDKIEKTFGKEVAKLVNGVTKISKLKLKSNKTKQAENFRKLVLAISEDLRVLLIKLADRLHNMRTLNFIKSKEKRKHTAIETMEIYAPLAERIGINQWKNEMEDISFGEINPEVKESIIARLNFLKKKGESSIDLIIKELKKNLYSAGIECTVSGRKKSPYSIWKKMQKQNVSFEQLIDIVAFRVIVKNKEDCYKTLGTIHSAYRVIPGQFKDYISAPKHNNYQSIHTGIWGPNHQRIELQIRTQKMHDVNENGVAAHWQYKQNASTNPIQYRWIRRLLDILEHAANSEEFLEHTKIEMFSDQIFCFSPAGDLITLPQGASPIDFAYSVHSEIGNKCHSCKINGQLMPLRTILKNGDQVEIFTSKLQTPSASWERLVVTGKAKVNIRRFLRSQQKSQFVNLGISLLNRAFKHENLEFSEKKVLKNLKKFNFTTINDLFSAVGRGQYSCIDIIKVVYPEFINSKQKDNKLPITTTYKKKTTLSSPIIHGLIPGIAIHYAGCCHPLPGDQITGIVTTGKGVTIHINNCDNLKKYLDEPNRWLDLTWDMNVATQKQYIGRISILLINEPGSLAKLSTIISKHDANIINLKITNRSENFIEIIFDIEVIDNIHLSNIIASLRVSSIVLSVERSRT